MEENVTLLAAFGAGLLSFISPCVLPLIPGYLSYISGVSLDEMRGTAVGVGGSAAQRRQYTGKYGCSHCARIVNLLVKINKPIATSRPPDTSSTA